MRKFFITLLLSAVLLNGMNAQGRAPHLNPAYGPDSASRIECATNLSTMAEFMKIDLYDYALESWTHVFNQCPEASKNIYISGIKIFQKRLDETKDPERRSELIDTLMMVYDRRIQYFGEEGQVLGRKGIDLVKYNEKEFARANEYLLSSVRLLKAESEPPVVLVLMQTSLAMFKTGEMDLPSFLDVYLLCTETLDRKIARGESKARIEPALNSINQMLSSARIQDCQALESAFRHRINPEAGESLLRLVTDLLTTSGCNNSKFYSEVNELLMEKSPSAERAFEVAKNSIVNEDFTKAEEYLKKAISFEANPEQKAVYQYQLSVILTSRLNKHKEAFEMAVEASKNKPGWGEPYLIKGSAMLAGILECTKDPFERSAAHWLAVDYFMDAIRNDPASEQKASQFISQSKAYFPSVEDMFFRSIKEGDPYTVGCWINATTRAKTK